MPAATGDVAVPQKVLDFNDDDTSVGTSTGSSGTTNDPGYIPLELFDYEIAKWLANSELKKQQKGVDEEMVRHDRLRVLSAATAFGALSDYVIGGATLQRENQSLLIDEYWSPVSIDVKYRGLTKAQIRGVLVLQNAFRTWIILKRYREAIKSKTSAGTRSFGDEKSIATALYIQSAVRRVIAKMEVESKISENSSRDKAFAKFCHTLKTGVMVTMYSRKYGTSPSRKLSLDDSLTHLTFSTSFGTKGKVELKSIHKVHTGISETMYPHSRQPQLSRCICLECLGDRVVDLELNTAKQTRDMYQGFDRLILLLSGTKSPFFIDNFGIPRRAGPSIIENAINDATTDEDISGEMFKSKPDEMRFWAALRSLQEEYDGWQAEQDGERRRFVLGKDTEEEKTASRLRTTESEQVKKEVAGANQKVTKFVRFVDQDGTTKIVEVGKNNNDIIDSRPAVPETDMVTPRSRDERDGRTYEEEQEPAPKKWLGSFRMRGFSLASKKGTAEDLSVTGERSRAAPSVEKNQPSTDEKSQATSQASGRSVLVELFGKIDDDEGTDRKGSIVPSSYSDDESSVVSSFRSHPNGSEASTQNAFSIASTRVTQESVASTSKPSRSSISTVSRTKEKIISELEEISAPVPMGSSAGRIVHKQSTRSARGSSVASDGPTTSPASNANVTKPFWRTMFCMGPTAHSEGGSDDDYYIQTGADKSNGDQSEVGSHYSSYDNRSNTEREESSGDDDDDEDEDDDYDGCDDNRAASNTGDTLDGDLFDEEESREESEESGSSDEDTDAHSEDAIAYQGSSDGFSDDD